MFLKKILPSLSSSVRHEDDDDYNSLEYSFATEYQGPPVVYDDVPEAVPVNIKHIPVATKVASASPLHKLSLPVVQPVVKINRSNKPELCSGDAAVVPSGALGCLSAVSDPSSVQGRNGKKGSCYWCFRGNRFTAKEVCIVCDAKYCSGCVLRAMGSMPEGRKCIDCIGFGIDESKRGTLGKCSRMLKWLLAEAQLKQVMGDEILCAANQLPPDLVYVNDEPLCLDELIQLQGCTNPPKKLRLGKYWYDKVFGFWGKQGEKPCQIITPRLKVGGSIKREASNGNTNVLINGREITQRELFILKLAGEKCEGSPHFWFNADGTYSEEGQKNMKGRIWGKTRTKLFCSLLALPIYSESANPSSEEVIDPNDLSQKMLCKLLLVGYDKSGTSTIFKEAKILYNVPFSEDERQNLKFTIQSNLYSYLGLLLRARAQFEEEYFARKRREFIDQPGPSARNTNQIEGTTIYSIGPRLKKFSDGLLDVMEAGNMEVIFPATSREYASYVEELWSDPAIQATYNRRNELQLLPRAATYFLEKAVEVSKTDYEPSDMDILYAEGVASSNRLTSMEFSFPKLPQDNNLDPIYQHDDSQRYELIRVHPRNLGGNCKWLEMFEDVDVVLFCISLIDYDQCIIEDSSGIPKNKMMASKQLFESVVNYPSFNDKDFLLVLNKFDLFEEKIEQVPLTSCQWFSDFHPVISHNHATGSNSNNNPSLAIRASHYIAAKFKALFQAITDDDERRLYAKVVTGLDQESVDDALRYAREVMKWAHEETNVTHEISSTSIEESTTS